MTRYIDANKLIEVIEDKVFDSPLMHPVMKMMDLMELIEEQPTADVVEVVQTLWKKTANEKPDSTRHLIVANGSLISHYGYYLKPKDKWYETYECKEEIEVPTYWMDMPTPPKESIYGECAVMDGKKVE